MNDNSIGESGRPPDDWVIRLRVWVWIAALQKMRPRSDDQMDKLFLPESSERRRTFNRVRRLGDDPERHSVSRYGYSLVDRIDAHPDYAGSAQWYRSPFYDLLTPPGLDANETTAKLRSVAEQFGLIRATAEQALAGKHFLPRDEAFRDFSIYKFRMLLSRLRKRAHINDIAMLALLYRESATSFDFDLATEIWVQLIIAVSRMSIYLTLPRNQSQLLNCLVYRRIARNNWTPLKIQDETIQYQIKMDDFCKKLLKRNILKRNMHRVRKKSMRQNELDLLMMQERAVMLLAEEKYNWSAESPQLKFLLKNFEDFSQAEKHHRSVYNRKRTYELVHADSETRLFFDKIFGDIPPLPKNYNELLNALKKERPRH